MAATRTVRDGAVGTEDGVERLLTALGSSDGAEAEEIVDRMLWEPAPPTDPGAGGEPRVAGGIDKLVDRMATRFRTGPKTVTVAEMRLLRAALVAVLASAAETESRTWPRTAGRLLAWLPEGAAADADRTVRLKSAATCVWTAESALRAAKTDRGLRSLAPFLAALPDKASAAFGLTPDDRTAPEFADTVLAMDVRFCDALGVAPVSR